MHGAALASCLRECGDDGVGFQTRVPLSGDSGQQAVGEASFSILAVCTPSVFDS